jgi:hypothetical protein
MGLAAGGAAKREGKEQRIARRDSQAEKEVRTRSTLLHRAGVWLQKKTGEAIPGACGLACEYHT